MRWCFPKSLLKTLLTKELRDKHDGCPESGILWSSEAQEGDQLSYHGYFKPCVKSPSFIQNKSHDFFVLEVRPLEPEDKFLKKKNKKWRFETFWPVNCVLFFFSLFFLVLDMNDYVCFSICVLHCELFHHKKHATMSSCCITKFYLCKKRSIVMDDMVLSSILFLATLLHMIF